MVRKATTSIDTSAVVDRVPGAVRFGQGQDGGSLTESCVRRTAFPGLLPLLVTSMCAPVASAVSKRAGLTHGDVGRLARLPVVAFIVGAMAVHSKSVVMQTERRPGQAPESMTVS